MASLLSSSSTPTPTVENRSTWGKRADGTKKGTGWLGGKKRPDGRVSSEVSVGFEINGKETEIPLMVPGLTKTEIDYLLNNDPKSATFLTKLPPTIRQKALAHAKMRIDAGKSPFAN